MFEREGYPPKGSLRQNASSVFIPYVSNFSYTASGGISQMRLGNGKWETTKFNDRMQVTELGLGASATDAGAWKVNYEYGELQTDGSVDAAKNTGNIAKQILSFNGLAHPLVQAYKYDSLYRITEAKETANGSQNWVQNWGYDRYGNRTSFSQNIAGLTNAPNPAIDAATNRFTDLVTFGYDKNGNITKDVDAVTSQSRTFVFNGDNKQTQVKDASNNIIGSYFYDGEGRRVKKVTDQETTVFVYSGGKLIAEYSTNVAPFEDAKVAYTTTDHLGTPRVITDQFGTVVSRRDFLPFGEEIHQNVGARTAALDYGSTEDNVRQKFTGYQKDTETSLDFAEARMYENRFGRFTAVDPLLASGKSANPQTFNRFIYVGNNPIARIDQKGLDWIEVLVGGFYVPVWKNGRPSNGEVAWSGGPVFFARNTLKWVALPPNGAITNPASFARQEEARWQYYEWTNFSGYGSVPILGNFLYGVAGMKKGEAGGALTGFALTALNIAALPKSVGGWLVELSFSAADYIDKELEQSGDQNIALAGFNAAVRVGKVPNTDSELITKGIHLHVPGVGRGGTEVAVSVGENGELVYRALGRNGRKADLANAAIKAAKEEVANNHQFRNNLIRTTEGFVENAASHPNETRRALSSGFRSVLDALRKLK